MVRTYIKKEQKKIVGRSYFHYKSGRVRCVFVELECGHNRMYSACDEPRERAKCRECANPKAKPIW